MNVVHSIYRTRQFYQKGPAVALTRGEWQSVFIGDGRRAGRQAGSIHRQKAADLIPGPHRYVVPNSQAYHNTLLVHCSRAKLIKAILLST